MKSHRIKISLLLIPTLIILGVENLRQTFSIPYVSVQTGNWILAGLTAISIALISQDLFSHFEQAERSLSQERANRAVIEERERLAMELHDRLAQSIFYVGAQIRSFRQSSRTRKITVDEWDEILLALQEMDENVRQAIFNLKQDKEATLDFRERIQRYMENAFSLVEVHWTVNFDLPTTILKMTEQVQLFGILQEAITNVRKHASASYVSVKLTESPDDQTKWVLEICDDGVGFKSQPRHANQYGLDTIKYRAKDIGATAFIESEEHGTCIQIVKKTT